jgi:hypothetical protein
MELDNLVLQHIDPEAHRMLTELRQKSNDIGSSKAFQSVDSSLFPSHFMLFNCKTKKHFDEKDHPQLWAPLHAFGNFTSGGEVYITTLGLIIPFLPGDSLYIAWGLIIHKCLEHEIFGWKGGQRICYALFCLCTSQS